MWRIDGVEASDTGWSLFYSGRLVAWNLRKDDAWRIFRMMLLEEETAPVEEPFRTSIGDLDKNPIHGAENEDEH